jgi:sulfonate transport system substrate-binding protein
MSIKSVFALRSWGRNAVLCAVAAGAVALAADASAQQPYKLRLQYGSATGQYVPIMPLAPKELYKHYGKSYTIEPIFMAGGGPALTALAAKEIDLGAMGPQAVASAAIEAKLHLVSIVQVLSTDVPGWNLNQFWARDTIKSAAELKGKTIAVNARNTSNDATVRIVLGRLGLKDGQDYQIAEMRFPAILAALESGRVDAGILVLPFNLLAEGKPLKPVFSTADAFGPGEAVTWTGRPDWIAQHRAMLVDFVEDHLRFRRWAMDPKTRIEAVKLMAQFEKQPVDRYESWLYTTKDNYRHPEGLIDVARYQKNVDDLRAAGLLTGTIDATKHVDTSITREAAARLR